jgi:hypothetical protein
MSTTDRNLSVSLAAPFEYAVLVTLKIGLAFCEFEFSGLQFRLSLEVLEAAVTGRTVGRGSNRPVTCC